MRPDHRAVEQDPLQVGVLQCLEDPLPDPLASPAVEPAPGGVPVAEALGQIPPRGAGPGDPEDGVHEKTVILGDLPVLAWLPGKEILDPVPILVRDGMAMSHGGASLLPLEYRH